REVDDAPDDPPRLIGAAQQGHDVVGAVRTARPGSAPGVVEALEGQRRSRRVAAECPRQEAGAVQLAALPCCLVERAHPRSLAAAFYQIRLPPQMPVSP